ncbi:hypothetical protein [Rugosimonospora africana]|uniref:Uncharacterized protein n=1 Tax=Rugosimonospora africana TaxID=556532 RepID=A0A8J3R745_9ACTN|nr:hypothetical protein [Rugosimonospora africana]GIH21246.1 hypothetical protein Raf01_94180 [Rugosimonospora africana]
MTAETDRESWRRHFAEILVSGDPAEVDAATEAAVAATAVGADWAAANAAGKAAGKRFRAGTAKAGDARSAGGPSQDGRAKVWADDPAGREVAWPRQLATRLFATPERWGWQAAPGPLQVSEPAEPEPAPRPEWVEPPRPDTSALRVARSSAVTSLTVSVVVAVLAYTAYRSFQTKLEATVDEFGAETMKVYQVAVILAAAALGLYVVRRAAGVGKAVRDIRTFEIPHRAMLVVEKRRYREAVQAWEAAVRRFSAAAAESEQAATRQANGPQWFPVRPAVEPIRVDVVGGDPRRHGWASLLVTVGTSVLSARRQVTLLDFTGQDVGGGLLRVAEASGRVVRVADFDDGAGADLLASVPSQELPGCLARVMTGGDGGDKRQERALLTDVLRVVLECLGGDVSFARLAAGVRVLRQGTGDGLLSDAEVSSLVGRVAEVDQNEWTSRQLRFLASSLNTLQGFSSTGPRPPWGDGAVSLVITPGRRDDAKDLLDRMLVQLAQRAMERGGLRGVLAVAGADRLGAEDLGVLSDHARRAGVLLMLMIDQPQGDLEKTVGTGGVVCVMKMYNHRDANVAAEFVGRGYRFVVNQVTRQVGKSFTDSGGDSFAATTSQSGGTHRRRRYGWVSGTDISNSRGHTWTGTRGWQTGDSIGVSTASSRVYEFVVEPQQILGMPETAFLLVDNSGHGRRVVMADGNPGICLLDRVATVPADQ